MIRSRSVSPRALAGALVVCLACGGGEADPAARARAPHPAGSLRADADPPPCISPGDPSLAAFDAVTGPTDGRIILPNGRALTPTGTEVTVGVFPLNVIPSHDGRYAFSTNGGDGTNMVQQIDVATGRVVASLSYPTLFHGLALDPSGHTLYASGGEKDEIHVIAVGDPGLSKVNSWRMEGYPMDLTLIEGGRRLWVSCNLAGEVREVDTDTGDVIRTVETAALPYQLALAPSGDRLYVTHSWEPQVSVINLTTARVTDTLATGKNPTGMLLSADGSRLHVAVADGDTIEVFDTASLRRVDSAPVGIFADGYHGVSPNSMVFNPAGRRIFVANAGDNAVEVYDATTLEHLGAVPTAWYPSALAISPDGSWLAVANAKGHGAGPSARAEASDLMNGTVSIIPLPLSDEDIAAGQEQVLENNRRPLTLHEISCAGKMFPIPTGDIPSPIEHVVLIVRENKTYDAYLGDLEVGDGDPALTLFGEEITPNTHQLAREFTLLDNFYTDSEDSDQGHLWLTGGFVNDYSERVNAAGRTQLTGVSKATDIETHYIFNHLQREGIDWVNYGEVVGLEVATFRNIDLDFPGYFYNMLVKDQVKAEYVASQVAKGVMPAFTYLLLPNDHTNGTDEGALSPESMVSDNDYGVGLVVEAISHSEFWPTTAIFIVEDDPQSGGDHVEAHRSPALVISPWAKRGHVSSVIYSIPSILRTIGLILGMPPMNQYDALALPMYDAFTAVPDYRPYDAMPRQVPDTYNTRYTYGAAESAKMDFSGPDRARGLGALLWRYRKGTEPPPIFGSRRGDADDDADEEVGEGPMDFDFDF